MDWDIDIFDFLDVKKKNGEERRRAQDLYTAINTNRLFITRDKEDGDWTLFDPYDVPNLLKEDAFGDKFIEYYTAYEEEFKNNPDKFNPNTVTIKAADLMRKICLSYSNEGMPFQHFIDNTNAKHKYSKEFGMITALNLCTEIMQGLRDDDTIVCNLGSINAARIDSKEKLIDVSRNALRALDNSIDLTRYPSENAKRTQLARRSVGIGILGEAQYIADRQIMYGSDKHMEVIDYLYGTVEEALNEYTRELAIEKGSCEIEGVRNAYLMATAPNTGSGVHAGTTASHEAVFDVEWMEETNGRNFKLTAPDITIGNFEYYVPVYKVDQFVAMDTTARRYKHIDQGISHTIHLEPEGLLLSTIRKLIWHASDIGLGSIYYLRSNPPSNGEVRSVEVCCVGCNN